MEKKKLGIMFFIFVLLLLLQLSKLQGARHVLHDEQGDKKVAWTAQEDKEPEITQGFENLMGEEKCEENDEECLRRRALTEPHLDYIYTQSHNKP